MGTKLTEYSAIISVLQNLYSGNVATCEDYGICDTVDEVLYLSHPKSYIRTFNSQFYRMVKGWMHYSGSTMYPVPSPVPGISEKCIFYNKYRPNWDKETEYGKLRYNLLEYLISEFKKLSNEYDESSTTE